MADIVKQILAKPIQLADQVIKTADVAHSFKQECSELKSTTEKIATLLRQAARADSDLYERPTRRIIDDTEQVLEKALALVTKCRANGLMKGVFTIIPTAAFKKMQSQLENSIDNMYWLLRVSSTDGNDDQYLGLLPIAANEPILCLIWEQIATLYTGSLEDRSDAAASLVSLALDNDRYTKLIIEEGGVGPLLKLIKEGRLEGQENAARAIGLLGRDPESVEHVLHAGVCVVFAKILKEGPMKVQAIVAWAVSELASNHPKCQDHFSQNNIISLLVGHLAFETVQEHSKYTITTQKNLSIHSVVITASSNPHVVAVSNEKPQHDNPYQIHNMMANGGSAKQNSGVSLKGRELEDISTKAKMKAMSARALWKLAEGNSVICKSITESRALLCFAVLLEKGTEEAQFNSAMALMEITAVAEQDADLRRAAFKPNSHAAKAVVDQLLKIIGRGDSDLLIPCVKAMGHLARTLKETETRIIGPLVQIMEEGEAEASREEAAREAAIALTKFGVFWRAENSVTDIGSSVLATLEWASRNGSMAQDPAVEAFLPEAKGRLELYQSRGSKGFH